MANHCLLGILGLFSLADDVVLGVGKINLLMGDRIEVLNDVREFAGNS